MGYLNQTILNLSIN